MDWRTAVGCSLAILALQGVGCGTVCNLRHAVGPKAVPEVPPDAPMQRVYGGVRADLDQFTSSWHNRNAPGYFSDSARLTMALMAIDLPLSAIGDTLTLPYVLAWEKGLLGMHLMHYPPDDPVAAWAETPAPERPSPDTIPPDAEVRSSTRPEASPPGGR